MAMVYLDGSALGITTAGPGGVFRVQPDLARQIGHLLDAGHEVVLAGETPALPGARAALPAEVTRRVRVRPGPLDDLATEVAGWLVTGSARTCEVLRAHRRLRSILVGSASGSAGHVDRPADVVVRSLTDAVLVILTDDAMASG